MERLLNGDVLLGPTDSPYWVRVYNRWGDPFTHILREPRTGETQITISEEASFQFQHLSIAQMDAFIELFNHRALHMARPGYFPTLPYFATSIVTNCPSTQDGS